MIYEQNSGFGYRASIKIEHKSKGRAFTIEPFFRYWDIEKSEIAYELWGTGWEPANNTKELGVQFTWRF